MAVLDRVARGLELLLELISGILIVGLTVVVVYAVVWRYVGGASPRWYDEVASIMLVWLTYYAGALAALKRGHIGVDGVLLMLPHTWRMAAAVLTEILVIGFFALLAWTGFVVLQILGGMSLVSLRWVSVQFTQSVIPIGAGLFIVAQLFSMPRHLAKVRAGISQHQEEIDKAVAGAAEDLESESEPSRHDDGAKGRA
ncbi:MAG TPA: TRAP transporter small permease subunit [Aestuariivirgaceae bacterium]|nr:TRAP transporter small permease subunit [Aestuariivirgaceae bacterium]